MACVIGAGMVAPSLAETVMLSRGDNDFGLGWLFLDRSGKCMVATPRHVIESENGVLIAPDLLDSFGRQHATSDPVAAADDLDLAFIQVQGELPLAGCTQSRLSTSSIQTIVDRMESATLVIATSYERQMLAVDKRATSRDADGGAVIAIAPSAGSEGFHRGMSGGAVLVSGRPVGMLLEVDSETGIGIALRFDLIAAELQKLATAPTSAPEASEWTGLLSSVTVLAGKAASAETGLSQFMAGSGELHLLPVPDRVVMVLRLPQRTVVNGVTVNGEWPEETSAISVEVADGPSGFLFAQNCAPAPNMECRFAPRRVDRVKLTFAIDAGADNIDPIKLQTLQIF
jgi:hypothetical protein